MATALTITVLVLNGCGGDKGVEPTVEEVQLAKLSRTWTCTKAVKDGVIQSAYATNFKLTIGGSPGSSSFTYSCSGRPDLSPWPANGTWTFGTNAEIDILRNDALPVTYVITDNQLDVTFNYQGTGFPARTKDVLGQWVFTFSK